MLSKKMEKAFNGQLNAEMFSAYLYLSMSAYFDSLDLGGFANWMRVQAQEEVAHAMKFYAHINERGGRVELSAIDAPKTDWDSPLAAFEDTYKHEQKVTGLIHDLVSLALAEQDDASGTFLQWFVSEQVEEEASASDLVRKAKMAGAEVGGLSMLDKELGQRVFVNPLAGEKGGAE